MGAAELRTDLDFIRRAIELAQFARQQGEVPVGALVMMDGEVIGEGWNHPIAARDPTAHAEIMALRAAATRRANYRLEGATLYATLEPCAMCLGAAINARVSRIVFGAWDLKAGACGSVFDLTREPRVNHRIDVFGGVRAEECRELLKEFFEARR